MGRIFNMGLLKLVLALGILFGLVGLIYYAHNQADKEIETFAKEQKEEETQAVTVDDYELKEIGDDNAVHWRLVAKKGTMEPSTKDVLLEDVNVNYYKEGKVSMQLNAPVGKANEISRIVILTSKGDKAVRVVGDEKQAQLETKKLELRKNNQFTATGGVNILWPGVAKVTGSTAEGSISKSNLEKIVIRGNTHASIDI
ncbi:MAG: LPS export ABC transporter periplasmic protein LptC [Candidatus Obscuribacterales bacterium]|nr:LPS export ABC transporter periplasmic protein LptC [Candidatus Obscuribacterales bacterium]